MRTATECCNYCESVGNIPKTKKRKQAEKDFSIIEGMLADGEEILLAFNAFLNWRSMTKNDGLFSVAVTGKRVILAQRIAFSNEVKQIKIDKITDSSFASNSPYTNFSTITLETISGEYKLSMDIKSAQPIYNELQSVI